MSVSKIGRYQIKSELGRGGMATVYLAHDSSIGRDVAVKLLPREFLHDPTFLERFQREARIIAKLEHPAIVPIYDFGEEGGQPYFVMRYMAGGSLTDRLRDGPLSHKEIAHLLERVGSALDHAHKQGIVHRDLKPGNIMFDQYGGAFLGDFGIARLAESTATLTGNFAMGTPAYMSPEQAQGQANVDGRADIYALGVILFELLTGQPPYRADTAMALAMMHITQPVPALRDKKPDVSPGIEQVIARAMAKQPDERFTTVSEMVTAFTLGAVAGAALDHTVIAAPTPKNGASDGANNAPTITSGGATVASGGAAADSGATIASGGAAAADSGATVASGGATVASGRSAVADGALSSESKQGSPLRWLVLGLLLIGFLGSVGAGLAVWFGDRGDSSPLPTSSTATMTAAATEPTAPTATPMDAAVPIVTATETADAAATPIPDDSATATVAPPTPTLAATWTPLPGSPTAPPAHAPPTATTRPPTAASPTATTTAPTATATVPPATATATAAATGPTETVTVPAATATPTPTATAALLPTRTPTSAPISTPTPIPTKPPSTPTPSPIPSRP